MQKGSLKVVKNRQGVKVWRLQWRENGRGRTRILGTFEDMNRATANAERKRILAPINVGAAAPLSASTLREFTENEYLTVKGHVWKDSTRITTENLIEVHILAELGGRPIVSISRRELQAHLDAKAAAGYSASIVGHVRWQLVAIFAMAKGDGIVTVDPTEGLVLPKCVGSPDKSVISRQDIHRAQLVLQLRERLVFRLAVCEGMRPGEITGLQVGDYRDGILHIERRIYRGKIDTPKSRRGRRIVPPTDITRGLLVQWIDLVQTAEPDAWIFPSETPKTPINYTALHREHIKPALASVGIHATYQVLRRTWVTEFSAAEKDPSIRAQLAGHRVDVHQNEYQQPQAEVLKRAMKKLGRHLQ